MRLPQAFWIQALRPLAVFPIISILRPAETTMQRPWQKDGSGRMALSIMPIIQDVLYPDGRPSADTGTISGLQLPMDIIPGQWPGMEPLRLAVRHTGLTAMDRAAQAQARRNIPARISKTS